MTEWLVYAGWLILGLLLLGLPLLCFSLRDFSRSLLEEVCQRKNPDRFGKILRDHERALLVCELLLVMALVGTCLTFAASPAFDLFRIPQAADLSTVFMWLARLAAAFLLLTFLLVGIPWTLSRVRGELVLFHLWPVLEFLGLLLSPVLELVLKLDRIVHRIFAMPEPDSSEATSMLTDELRAVVDEGRREGILQSNASRMIHRVVDLQSEDVAAIMTPRTDMVTIPSDTVLRDALPLLVEHGYSRVPVVGRSVDDVVGILYARDLLAAAVSLQSELDSRTVDSIAREVLYVPESQGIETLLEKMQQQKVHMAIVVDEYSGVSGLVTLEDILEEIVGDIEDEYDEEEKPMIASDGDGCTLVDARFHIDDLNRELNLNLPEDEEFDTVGGFLMCVQGRIPARGDLIETHGLSFEVLDADERQLKQLRISRLAGTSAAERTEGI